MRQTAAVHLVRSIIHGSCVQVMGPDDSYLVQYSDDVKPFWAETSSLALGACFKPTGQAAPPRVAVTEVTMTSRSGVAHTCSTTPCLHNPRHHYVLCRGSLAGLLRRASKRR